MKRFPAILIVLLTAQATDAPTFMLVFNQRSSHWRPLLLPLLMVVETPCATAIRRYAGFGGIAAHRPPVGLPPLIPKHGTAGNL